MTTRSEKFIVGDHPRLEVTNTARAIVVVAGEDGVIAVTLEHNADNYTVEQIGDTVIVRPEKGFLKRMFSSDIVVAVPSGTDIEASNASGDVAIEVTAADLEIATASGDVRTRRIDGSARIKVASGDVVVDEIAGALNVIAASGDLRVQSVDGDLVVKTASGDINVGRVGGTASINSASGDLRIGRLDGGEVRAHTLSGDVVVGIPPRRRIELDMQSVSGSLRNKLPEGDGSPPEASVHVRAISVSGNVTLRGATE